MKKLKNFCLAIVALSLLATPALTQNRSNKGGAVTGAPRSDQVQAENKKGDKDRDPSPDKDGKKKGKPKKTRTREGWEKKAEHNAKGHSH